MIGNRSGLDRQMRVPTPACTCREQSVASALSISRHPAAAVTGANYPYTSGGRP